MRKEKSGIGVEQMNNLRCFLGIRGIGRISNVLVMKGVDEINDESDLQCFDHTERM